MTNVLDANKTVYEKVLLRIYNIYFVNNFFIYACFVCWPDHPYFVFSDRS